MLAKWIMGYGLLHDLKIVECVNGWLGLALVECVLPSCPRVHVSRSGVDISSELWKLSLCIGPIPCSLVNVGSLHCSEDYCTLGKRLLCPQWLAFIWTGPTMSWLGPVFSGLAHWTGPKGVGFYSG
jgi:hypothetical protein